MRPTPPARSQIQVCWPATTVSHETLSELLYFLFGPAGKYLDIAGTFEILTCLMDDCGFAHYWKMSIAMNIFLLKVSKEEMLTGI